MKVELCTLCDFAQENAGKLTIVGTFDTIVSRQFPCVHNQLSMVVRLRFDTWEFTSHKFRIETLDLDGKPAMDTITGSMEVRGVGNTTAVSHLVFGINNLHFKAPGVIHFVIYMDDKEITSMPLYLRQAPQSQ